MTSDPLPPGPGDTSATGPAGPVGPTVPVISYPTELPVSDRRDDLAAAIRDHQVVVVAGETGSGKTTQLPKICLELGRGSSGRMIGHTQPRRMAARTVAARISDELASDGLGSGLGDLVGYQVRFTDETSPATRLKLMTDGILLAELQRDRDLDRYDTLVIDEAHERSLNIDFLLGYLTRLLPRRPDLRVIVTSATIDPHRFARHFALDPRTGRVSAAAGDAAGTGGARGAEPPVRPAPVIEVSGRTYPVEVRYRPLVGPGPGDDATGTDAEGEGQAAPEDEPGQRDQTEAVVDGVRELADEGAGDVLVFLPGEREIRDTADALTDAYGRDATDPRSPRYLEILPLYSRLSAAEQQRVFSPAGNHRRVVLATNVAETSLTVPGIRYVIDTGLARISRYSARTKVQRLPVEPVSQASADQRAGRCGRVAPGIAIRLYAEEDYLARPAFTDPEILRTNLASVILQMATLGLGDVAAFPFVEPPDNRQVRDGRQLLQEIGALSTGKRGPRVTKLGRRVARLPVDPRLARMILEAERRGVVREVLTIVAALSVKDPRERPADEQSQADQAHARFRDKTSDFLTLLNLWDHLVDQQRTLGSSQFRKLCRREYLNYLRVREWQDLESQLRQICREMGVRLGPRRDHAGGGAVDSDGVHQSLLSGLLSQIGALTEREERGTQRGRGGQRRRPGPREYAGARGARFAIHPGSALKGQNPSFVMSAELVETTRLWARENAAIDPAWAEKLGAHLAKRHYAEPHWSARRGAVVATEKVTLLGVPLVADRLVTYHRTDPGLCRELFIRHALVEGDWAPEHADQHAFFAQNRRLLAEAEELEHRTRRRDLVVDEQTLFDFYDARIGDEVVSSAHFDRWWARARQQDPDLLTFDPAMLTHDHADEVRAEDFPTSWQSEGLTFPVSYHFEPGAEHDGLTIDLPVSTLNQVDPGEFSWVVPGMRHELVTALLRSLPKQLRTACVPAPDTAAEFLEQVPPGSEPLLDAVERYLRSSRGVHVPREAWDLSRIPAHLRPTFRVLDEHEQPLARGKDLAALQAPLASQASEAVQQTAADAGATATGETSWTFGELAPAFTRTRAGQEVRGYPALVDEGDAVGLAVLADQSRQQAEHRDGLRRLVALALDQRDHGEPPRRLREGLDNTAKLTLAGSPYPSVAALLADCRLALAGEAVDAALAAGEPVGDEAAFEGVVAAARRDHDTRLRAVLDDVRGTLEAAREADRAVSGRAEITTLPALTDMQAQLAGLVHEGFVAEAGTGSPGAGAGWLRRLPVYLQALVQRRARLAEDPGRDRQLQGQVEALQAAWQQRVDAVGEDRALPLPLRRVRWLLEEYRVSLWAQHLGTAERVSDARIRQELEG